MCEYVCGVYRWMEDWKGSLETFCRRSHFLNKPEIHLNNDLFPFNPNPAWLPVNQSKLISDAGFGKNSFKSETGFIFQNCFQLKKTKLCIKEF